MTDQPLPGRLLLDQCVSPVPLRTASKPPRVVVVGAGLMGRWHAYTARRSGGKLVAIVDSDAHRAKTLAKGANAVTRLEDILAEGIDAVHICTPLETHYDLVHTALGAGAHVLVEKPVTETLAHTTDLIQTAMDKGLYLCPVHQFPFQHGVARTADYLAKIGQVHEISFTICSGGGSGETGVSLDGTVNDILPHPLSVLHRLWPETELNPGGWNIFRPSHGNLHVAGPHGKAMLAITISMQARPTCCEMVVRCDGGTVSVDFFHGFAVLENGKLSRLQKILRPFRRADGIYLAASMNLMRRTIRREPAYPGLRTLITQFYGAVSGNSPFPIDPSDTIAVARARAAIMERSA